MTAANPERATPTPQMGRSGPVARVSRGILDSNIAIALEERAGRGETLVGDARADAWGHGAAVVASALRERGVDLVRVDEAALAALRAQDIAGLTTTAEPNVDPHTVFGLPEAAAGSRAALRLTGRVLTTKRLLRGEGVSYGFLHRAAADTRVALVTGGYAQGVVRAIGGQASVAIDRALHPIVGRVAMDVCVVDIGTSEVARGAEAVLLGDPAEGEPGIADWVTATGLTAAELVTAVGLRSFREHVA